MSLQADGRRSHVRNATEVKSEETATEDSAEQGLEKGKEYEVAYEPVACWHQHRHICLSKILRQECSVLPQLL